MAKGSGHSTALTRDRGSKIWVKREGEIKARWERKKEGEQAERTGSQILGSRMPRWVCLQPKGWHVPKLNLNMTFSPKASRSPTASLSVLTERSVLVYAHFPDKKGEAQSRVTLVGHKATCPRFYG